MNRNTLSSFVAVLTLSTPAHPMEGAQSQSAASQKVEVARERGTGNFIIRYPNGKDTGQIVFEPATKIEPYVDSVVTYATDSDRYHYRYTMRNGAKAQQALYSVNIGVTLPSEIVGTPPGWEPNVVRGSSRIAWYKRGYAGISPTESEDGFGIESEMLPAPSEARFRGNVRSPSVPADLPQEVVERLTGLLQQDYLVVPVLAPLVPSGSNEPELTRAVMLSRIRGRYQLALYRSKHPQAQQIDQLLTLVIQASEAGRASDTKLSMSQLRTVLAGAVSDRWAATLSRGLTLTLDHVDRRFTQ